MSDYDRIPIPEARKLLNHWAEEFGLPQLAELASRMYRRSAVRQASRTSPYVDADMAQEIRDYAEDNPGMSEQEIAGHFGVNPGRVSEALHGLR